MKKWAYRLCATLFAVSILLGGLALLPTSPAMGLIKTALALFAAWHLSASTSNDPQLVEAPIHNEPITELNHDARLAGRYFV